MEPLNRRRFLSIAGGATAASLLGGCSSAPQRDKAGRDVVRISTLGLVSDAAVYLADAGGYFARHGIALSNSPSRSGSSTIADIGTGHLDVSGGGLSAGLFNASQGGVAIKVVAPRGRITPTTQYGWYMAQPRWMDKLHSFADLRGLRVAITAPSGTMMTNLHLALSSVGLGIKDVDLKILPYADMGPAFENDAIDVGSLSEPYVTTFTDTGVAKPWKSVMEAFPGQEYSVMFFSSDFAARRDVADRFMMAYLMGARDYNDAFITRTASPQRLDSVVDTLCKRSAIKDPKLWRTMRPAGIAPDGSVDPVAVHKEYDVFNSVRLISPGPRIDVDALVDNSFAQQAVAQLGPYASRT